MEARCAECHQGGKEGAPKIGDRAAWIPRLKHGMDFLVRSAINGHGAMPPRGGMADLTDTELRGAIAYMFNPDSTAEKGTAPAAPQRLPSSNRRIAGDMEIYLGVVSDAVGSSRSLQRLKKAETRSAVRKADSIQSPTATPPR